MRFLVTGGTGFLGSQLAEYLMGEGHQVTLFDRRRVSRPTKAAVVQGDVRNAELVAAVVARHDAVFHLAGIVGFANVLTRTRETILTATHGTANVLAAAATEKKRVLLSSTSACYGHGIGPVREGVDSVLGPTARRSWSYAYAKGCDEALAFAYHMETNLPVIVTRVFNTVGAGQSAAAGFVLPRFVQQALAGEPLTVYWPGTQTRTFGHVRDISRALALLMECDEAIGQLVNVGGAETVTIRALAEQVIHVTRSASAIEVVRAPYGKQYEDIQERVPDLTRLQTLVGWYPRHTLADAIYDVVEEHRALGRPHAVAVHHS